MTEGMTCYERDEVLCDDPMCLRGCKLRNERLARSSTGIESVLRDCRMLLVGTEPYVPIGVGILTDFTKMVERIDAELRNIRAPQPVSDAQRPTQTLSAEDMEALESLARCMGFGRSFHALSRALEIVKGETPQRPDPAYAAWQPIETAPKDGTPLEVCNTRHPSHAPVIVRWTSEGLSEELPEPHWCDAATADGSALYFNQNYFDFWKPTTALPSTEGK